jgi:hypothetical protein
METSKIVALIIMGVIFLACAIGYVLEEIGQTFDRMEKWRL